MSGNSTSHVDNVLGCLTSFVAESEEKPSEGLFYTIVVAVLTSLLAFVILVGNGLIIVSVSLVRKLRQPANYLIVSLALSDFLVALVVLPLTIIYDILGEWVFGSTLCNIHVSFDVICCATSILNLVMISIDRYRMVTHPLTYPKKRTAKLMALMICTAWVLACLVIFPALFGFTKNVTDDPSWITLGPSSGFRANASNSSFSPVWRKVSTIKTHEPATYWTQCLGSSAMWQFAVDLERDHRITEIRFESHLKEISQIKIQLQMLAQDLNQTTVYNLTLTTSTALDLPASPARYIRIFLNDSDPGNLAGASFEVFGELIHGKTCLISQEVWFTIYSTVGSFYLPLAVMLFMYYKIYLEASRFKARQRARSKSLSDQPHSIMSQPLRRKHLIVSDDSTSDLTDYYEIHHGGNRGQEFSANAMQSISMQCAAENNLSPSRGPPDEVTPVDQGSVFTTTSRDNTPTMQRLNVGEGRTQCSSDSLIYETGFAESTGSNNIAGLSHCNRSCGAFPFEVNGNFVENSEPARNAQWCKKLHYSSASVYQSDPPANDQSQTNGQSHATKPNHRNGSLIKSPRSFLNSSNSTTPFAKRGSSIFSIRRKYTARSGSFLSFGSRANRGSLFLRRSSTSHRDRMRNAKATRTLGIIVAAFTFCWLPFFILTFIRPFVCEHPESQDCFPLWLVRLVLWLGYLNSALNPFIYVGFSSDLRETFRFLVCCKCTNVDRRLAQIELRQAIEEERKQSLEMRESNEYNL